MQPFISTFFNPVKQKSFLLALVICFQISLGSVAMIPASSVYADGNEAFIHAYIPQGAVSLNEVDTTTNQPFCYESKDLGISAAGNWRYLDEIHVQGGDSLSLTTYTQDNCSGPVQKSILSPIPNPIDPAKAVCWLNPDNNTLSGCNGTGTPPNPSGEAFIYVHIPQGTVSLNENDTTTGQSLCYSSGMLGANSGHWVLLHNIQVNAGDSLSLTTYTQDNCSGPAQQEPLTNSVAIPQQLTPSTTCWINIDNNMLSGCNGHA